MTVLLKFQKVEGVDSVYSHPGCHFTLTVSSEEYWDPNKIVPSEITDSQQGTTSEISKPRLDGVNVFIRLNQLGDFGSL